MALLRTGESQSENDKAHVHVQQPPVCTALQGGLHFLLVSPSVFVRNTLRLPFLDSSVLSIDCRDFFLVAGVYLCPPPPAPILFTYYVAPERGAEPPVLVSARCELAHKLSESGNWPVSLTQLAHGISGCCVSLAASKRRRFKFERAGFRCFIFISASNALRATWFLGFVTRCVLLPRSWVPP